MISVNNQPSTSPVTPAADKTTLPSLVIMLLGVLDVTVQTVQMEISFVTLL